MFLQRRSYGPWACLLWILELCFYANAYVLYNSTMQGNIITLFIVRQGICIHLLHTYNHLSANRSVTC